MTITQQELKKALHYCQETGKFTWLVTSGAMRKGSEAGCDKVQTGGKTYRSIGIHGLYYKAHRLAFLYMTGSFPADKVDHEDGNGLNNSWTNLRSVTNLDNGKNQRISSHNTSGVTGVCWCKVRMKWLVRINANGSRKHIGFFASKEDAIAARKTAETEFGYHPNHGTSRPL